MPYRSVCRRGTPIGGRVRQDEVSITHDILQSLSPDERRGLTAIRHSNPAEFRKWIRQYKAEHRNQIQQLIESHNAEGASPGILRFINEVVRNTPPINAPPKPAGFLNHVRVETYPGRHNSDVHLEGRAADVYFNVHDERERLFGNWLFDYCVANCERYKIQGVIFGTRQWFSETRGGREFLRTQGDHNRHVHIELNCDGANLR